MDKPFAIIIIVVILAAAVTMGATTKITLDNIEKLPSASHGLITAKTPENVTLSDGTILYLSNNPTVYSALKINQTYSFTCYLNYTYQKTYIITALPN